MPRIALALLALCAVSTAVPAAPGDLPRPERLEPAVQFWTRVYTEVDTNAGLIHDRDNLAIVYEAIELDPNGTRRARVNAVRASKKHYRGILLELAQGRRDGLSPEQRRVLELWPRDVSNDRLRRAAHNIRFQLGQSDKFRAGLVRSGAWEPHIRRTLEEMGLPEELAALPHVESSFNPDAWSRVGAAGLWQFTRSTGRRFMRIDHVIDERMDPFAASIAAARLLRHNYSVTGDWALAITAYNHGLAGIRRAVRTVGSEDIADIVERYNGRIWGFASRNFYAAFLAAVDVDFHSERYFGNVRRRDPLQTETVELPFYAPADALASAFEVDRRTLRELNRSLRSPIWDGLKHVPRGFELRLPKEHGRPPASELLANVDQGQRYFAQIPDKFHRVRRGEALSTIASRYGVSMRQLMALNNLRNAHYIRAGQTLRLPVPDAAAAGATAKDGVYVVRRGDTLSGIATRVGLNAGRLAAINGLADADAIYPGQKLHVARKAAAAAEPEPEPEPQAAASAGIEVASADDSMPEQTSAADAAQPAEESAAQAEAPQAQEADAAAAADGVPAEQVIARLETLEARAFGDIDSGSEAITAGDNVSTAVVEPAGAGLSSDPADYSVGANGTIEIQAAETLGHYAEWLDLRASQLRRINGMRYGTPVIVGHRLELDFSRVDTATFERRRLAYHEELQARFFEQFRIAGTEKMLVQRGDSLWTLARRSDNVPVWLLRQYNPDLDFEALHPGIPVTVPLLERQADADEPDGEPVELAETRVEE